ncbi:MAG: hydrogenase nickel incorporation protein HypB [Ruminococcaceae bacterium]|nr:hydrogenase nickel incorporation protein HypB [Oscillospiraceae bacterium]
MEIKVMHQVMAWNEDVSDAVKAELAAHRVCLINVMGSPGAGKTTTLISLIDRLRDRYRIGVIEGDIAGQIDADTIHGLGIPVTQIDTDGACHIEAMSIQKMLPEYDLENLDILFVENIGNLVCPAEFNIGESFRLALLSIPEGDDKVEKYPLMFATSQALAMNKYDLKDYFDFDDSRVEKAARGVNPDISIFRVSSRDGSGLDELAAWISKRVDEVIRKECD